MHLRQSTVTQGWQLLHISQYGYISCGLMSLTHLPFGWGEQLGGFVFLC